MKTRPSARVLLFDSADRLLLVKSLDGFNDDPVERAKKVFWCTVGGALEPGETPLAAARRELCEETGIVDATFGPAVWYGEHVMQMYQQPVLSMETYFVARTSQVDTSQHAWTALERETLLELRWWTLDELEATTELIYPRILPSRIRAAARAGADAVTELIVTG